MKKNFKSILFIFILLCFLGFYLFHAVFMMEQFIDYSFIFITKFIPVSFPLLMITHLLLQYGIIYYLPKGEFLSVFLLSIISGFPNGVKFIHDLVKEKNISLETGNKLLLVCHFPNPIFVFGTLFLVLQNLSLTIKLFFSIIFSNLCPFLFFKQNKENTYSIKTTNSDFSKNLYHAIMSTGQTLLLIYGTSIFFYLLFTMITQYISFSSYQYVFFCGIFDLTKGVLATTLIQNQITRAFYILFFISFGGISIHIQVKSILSDTPLSYHYFVFGRILSTILAFIFFFLFIH